MNCTTCNTYLSTDNCKVCGVITEVKKPTKIRKMSKQLSARIRLYNMLRIEFLKDKRCAVCQIKEATEVHHKQGKIGNLLLEQTKWLPICRVCHTEITINSKEAIEQGYSLKRNGND